MPRDSYNSLLKHAVYVMGEINKNKNTMELVNDIKKEYKDKGRWEAELLEKHNNLIKRIEREVYIEYGGFSSGNIVKLNEKEELEFINSIKKLSNINSHVDIRIQNKETVELSNLQDIELLNSQALRILPKNLNYRIHLRSGVSARLTINIHKKYIVQLAKSLISLFDEPSLDWVEQAKIIGPRKFATQTEQAVIYLSEAGVEHAEEITQRLKTIMPLDAFIEHTPIGMQKIDTGISYSELLAGGATSHGQTRSQIIASAIAESLLTDRSIKQILPRTLQKMGYDVANPSLVAQMLRDSHLKSGLFGSMHLKNSPASDDVKGFIADPLSFTSLHAISGDSMTKMGKTPSYGRAHLVKIGPNSYAVEYRYEPSSISPSLAVDAYFLGYNGANQSSVTPAYVDIPIKAAENSFLFTGSLTGCSVIVTKLNETTYRVYHDGRVNSSVLYDNVVMAFDFQDYQVAGTDEGLAMAYMRFTDGKWQLVLQRQEYQIVNNRPIPVLREGNASTSGLYPDEQFSHFNLDKFASYRNSVHQKVKRIAAHYNINTENIADGVYSDGGFSSQNPAIRPWINIYNETKQKIDDEISQLNSKKESLKLRIKKIKSKKIKTKEDEFEIETLDESINNNRKIHEYYKKTYMSVLSEILSVERSWLWLQIKQHYGQGEVVKIEEGIQAGIRSHQNIIEEKYNKAVCNDIWGSNFLFNEGVENYNKIDIASLDKNISSLKMKELYLEGKLSVKERGALAQYITLKENSEFINHIFDIASKTDALFKEAGCVFQRIAPQDFYLPLMGDDSGGRCYSLVRAMSVALALEGSAGANELLNKMFIAGASPKEQNSILLKSALENLHLNMGATQASTDLGQFNLNEIKRILVEGEETKMYAINSQTHSMLLGKTINNGEIHYYFYDPNIGIYAFDNQDKLFSTLDKFMFENKMAQQYRALDGKFSVVSINTQEMSDVQVGSGLTVDDLTRSDNLSVSLQQRKEIGAIVDNQRTIVSDKKIQASFVILEAEKWGERLKLSVDDLVTRHQLDEKWLPVFENVEKLSDSRYRIQFIHKSDAEDVRWVETEDSTFIEFKEYFRSHIAALKEHYSFDNMALQRESTVGETEHVDGLNIAMGIQAIIQWSANKNRQSTVSSGQSSNLAEALRIHSYISYSMMGHGAVNDSIKVGKIAYSLWREGNNVAKTVMNNFSLSLAHMANEGIGIVFQGAMVGFDIYELVNAQNEAQVGVFGTQLAFDAASLGAGLVGIGASALGAEIIAGVAGPLAVPLMGLGIGIAELVIINEGHALEAEAVGTEFAIYQRDYQNAAITYDAEKGLLSPTPNVVIKNIDFKNGYFELGSQYIYRGVKKTWSIKYCCLSDFQAAPSAEIDKTHAINIREAVGVTQPIIGFDANQQGVTVLPVAPKSYIRYKYSTLLGATTRGDNGFSILRQMEKDYQFYFDFLYCAMEYIIVDLEHEYVDTPVQINLDDKNRHLVVPKMPSLWQGYIEHIVTGEGGEYQITINHGASLKLIDGSYIDKKNSQWVIDTSLIDSNGDAKNIQIMDDYIKIGDITVSVDDSAKQNIIRVINGQYEIREINFIDKTAKLINIDGQNGLGKNILSQSICMNCQ